MSKIRPFAALRPSFSNAPDVACLPYDVMDRQEAAEMAEENPKSFLRIVRSEIELPGVDAYDERVYEKAKENLEAFEENGYLIRDKKPHLYVYAQTMEGRTQRGIVACANIDEYLEGKIKRHELTRVEKELDRFRHFDVTNANTEPVFFAYRSHSGVKAVLDEICLQDPAVHFTSEDGITHTCYVVDDQLQEGKLLRYFEEMDALYIADGHHRTASAAKVSLKRREEHPNYSGDEAFHFFLAVLFDEDELMIMDYNRVVKDLNGLSEEEFLNRVKEVFTVEKSTQAVRPQQKGTFGMYLGDAWYRLTIKEAFLKDKDLIASLDVSLLQDHLLAPVLGVEDPRSDERIDFVGGIRGLEELERRVAHDMSVAFSFYPTSAAELFTVADAGEIMPPKSTWFEPKLRSGLFVHTL